MISKNALAVLSGLVAVALVVLAVFLHGAPLPVLGATVAGMGLCLWGVTTPGRRSALVVMVAHDAYRRLDLPRLAALMATRVLVDGRFVVEPAAARAAGFVFRGVGRGA